MAIQAPSHGEITDLHDPVHLLHFTVALRTVKPGCTDMLGMAEKSMIRKIMYLNPSYRHFILICLNKLVYLKTSGVSALPYNYVAVHAL